MDVFSLIDSPDIREYLRSIKYEFSPTDKAYVIWKCRHITQERRLQLWWDVLGTAQDDPALDPLYLVIETLLRIGPLADEGRDTLSEEDKEILSIPNDFVFPFPCPFQRDELLHRIGGEGIFETQPLRFLGYVYHKRGGRYGYRCEYSDASGNNARSEIPIFDLERWTTYLHGGIE